MILLHSFGTNSEILSGLKQLLNKYFDVSILDIPGFIQNSRPIEEYSFQSLADYMHSQLIAYEEEKFVLAGISFGFGILAHMDLSRYKLKGVIAIEPFTGCVGLNLSELERISAIKAIDAAEVLHLEKTLFSNFLLKKIFGVGEDLREQFLKDFDPKAFFECLRLILSTQEIPKLDNNLKYILILNEQDGTLRSGEALKYFNHPNVLHLPTTLPHFPTNLSSAYFASHLPDMDSVLEYLECR